MNDTSLSRNKYRKVDTSQTALVLCLKVVLFCCLQEETNVNALCLRLGWIYMRTRVKFTCTNKIEAVTFKVPCKH